MPWLGFTYHYGFTGRVLGRLVCAHSQKNITSSWVDLKVVGNFAGECSVSTAPWQGSSLFFSFKGSLTLRDRFQLSNSSIVSLFIHLCTDVYCEPGIWQQCSKGSSHWPPIPHNAIPKKSETIFLLFLLLSQSLIFGLG